MPTNQQSKNVKNSKTSTTEALITATTKHQNPATKKRGASNLKGLK